jgi:hypothetical protein
MRAVRTSLDERKFLVDLISHAALYENTRAIIERHNMRLNESQLFTILSAILHLAARAHQSELSCPKRVQDADSDSWFSFVTRVTDTNEQLSAMTPFQQCVRDCMAATCSEGLHLEEFLRRYPDAMKNNSDLRQLSRGILAALRATSRPQPQLAEVVLKAFNIEVPELMPLTHRTTRLLADCF